MANPSIQEKLASQQGRIYVASVMPLMSGTPVVVKQMAHVAGYYAGITYSGAPSASAVSAKWDYILYLQRGVR